MARAKTAEKDTRASQTRLMPPGSDGHKGKFVALRPSAMSKTSAGNNKIACLLVSDTKTLVTGVYFYGTEGIPVRQSSTDAEYFWKCWEEDEGATPVALAELFWAHARKSGCDLESARTLSTLINISEEEIAKVTKKYVAPTRDIEVKGPAVVAKESPVSNKPTEKENIMATKTATDETKAAKGKAAAAAKETKVAAPKGKAAAAEPAPKAAKGKAAAPAKEAAEGGKRGREGIADTAKIKVGDANTGREGSWRFVMIDTLQSSKTVGEARAKLAKNADFPDKVLDVSWVVRNGYITLS